MNVAWLIAIGYTLSVIVFALNASETIHYNRAFIGTILLLIGYTILAFAYTTDYITDPSKPLHEQKIKFDLMKRTGFGFIAVFLLLNMIGIIGLTARYYDVFGILGYGLFTFGQVIGVYLVMAYLVFSIVYKWHSNDNRDNIQVIGKLCIFGYYLLILLS
jgi:hypothetical protein